jgi:hypothetical protein
VANLDYTAAEINEKLARSVGQYQSAAQLPSPSGQVGIRHAIAENILSVSNGTVERKVAMLDENGDLFANIIPRTGTLSELMTVVGDEGEIASPTDVAGVFKFTGNGMAGGSLIAPKSTSSAGAKIKQHSSNMPGVVSMTGYTLSGPSVFGSIVTPINVWFASGTSKYFTTDGGVTNMKLPDFAGATLYFVSGNRIFAAGPNGLMGYMIVTDSIAAFTGTWSTLTLDANFATLTPYVWGFEGGETVIGAASSTNLYFHYLVAGATASGTVDSSYPLTFSGVFPMNNIKQFNDGLSPLSRGIIVLSFDRTTMHYKNYGATAPAWVEVQKPLNASTIVDFWTTKDKLVVTYIDQVTGKYKVATKKFTWNNTSDVLFEGYKYLKFESTEAVVTLANLSSVFLINSTLKKITIIDEDGVDKTIEPYDLLPLPASQSINNLAIHELGLYFTTALATNSARSAFVENDGSVSYANQAISVTAITSPQSPFFQTKLMGNSFLNFGKIFTLDGKKECQIQGSARKTAAGNSDDLNENAFWSARTGVANTYSTATQAAIDFVLPRFPRDMMVVSTYFKAAVTTLTIKPAANDSTTVVNGVGANVTGGGATLVVSNVAVNQLIRLTYFAVTNEWILG